MSIATHYKLWSCVLCLVISGTTPACRRATGQEAFFSLHQSEMERRFRQLSLNEQYEILMASRSQVRSIPRFAFVEMIIQREDNVLPFLQERLQSAAEEGEIDDLLNIFLNLAHRGALQGRKDLWELLKKKITLVKTLKIRRNCLYSLHQIEQEMKYKSFFFSPNSGARTPEQQREEFQSLPLEAQLELCLFTMSTEPPHKEFAEYLTDRGPAILPLLIAVLKADYYERTTAKIFYLIELLSQKGALCGRNDAIDVLNDRIDTLADDKEARGSYVRILDAVSRCRAGGAALSSRVGRP
jgi:hypothetical protein